LGSVWFQSTAGNRATFIFLDDPANGLLRRLQKTQGLLHFERAVYDFLDLRLRLMLGRGVS
jgi:hypothetical protein